MRESVIDHHTRRTVGHNAAVDGRILGALEVAGPGGLASLGGTKQRAVLAQFLLRPGHVVAEDRLVAVVWGDHAADGARHTLQVYVSNLRRAIETVEPGAGQLLERAGVGYRLSIAPDDVDAGRFAALSERGRALAADGRPGPALALLDEALALWRGPALADFDEHWASAEARRLDELRLATLEARVDAGLALGRHGDLIAEIERLVDEHPLRERLRGQLMLALYRAGRQADALAAYRAAHRHLSTEVGVEPGPELRTLERRILDHDPALATPAPPDAAPGASASASAVRVTWTDNRGRPRTLGLGDGRERATVGRLPGSDVPLPWDEEASRSHAELRRLGDEWMVVDAGSLNGTRVNGERVSRRALRDGDEIRVGSTTLLFCDPDADLDSLRETRLSS